MNASNAPESNVYDNSGSIPPEMMGRAVAEIVNMAHRSPIEISSDELEAPITLVEGSYLSSNFWTLPEGVQLRVTDARHNPGQRFVLHLFESDEGLAKWTGSDAASAVRRHTGGTPAMGSLSAQASVIALHPINDVAVVINVRVGDVIKTSRGDYRIVEVPLRDPFLVRQW